MIVDFTALWNARIRPTSGCAVFYGVDGGQLSMRSKVQYDVAKTEILSETPLGH